MPNQSVTLLQFVARARDDVRRFQVMYERAQRAAPGALPDKQTLREWMGQYRLFIEQEYGLGTRRPRTVSEVTVVRKRQGT
jgi:hypothetical protein